MTDPRKRTSSFSLPSPTKLQRTGTALNMTSSSSSSSASSPNPLRRTESLFSILPSDDADEPMANASQAQQLPYYKTLQYHKDQRLKRQAAAQHDQARSASSSSSCSSSLYSPASLTLALAPSLKPKHKAKRVPVPSPSPSSLSCSPSLSPNINTNTTKRQRPVPSPLTKSTSTSTSHPLPPQPKAHTQIFLPSARPLILTLRTSSPLSPHPRTPLCSSTTTSLPIPPPQRIHPRSRPEPDLYRKAIRQHMGTSPEGRRVLCMGPRLAMSIMDATRELERIVAAGLVGVGSGSGMEGEWGDDGDVVMGDSTTSLVGSSSMGYEYGEKSGVPPVLTNSWVLVRGEDWEMVDCAA